MIQSVKGTEFVNGIIQRYFKRQGISFDTTHNLDVRDAIVRRFERTLKTKMRKYFTKNNIYRYFDVINKLLTG